MRRYIRSTVPGGTYFFTVNLQDRSQRCLVEHVDVLRDCFRRVRTRHSFTIDAMVVLPEHLHAIWTLPPDDADFPARWMLVKQAFTRKLRESGALTGGANRTRGKAGERSVWQRRYWEHQIRDEEDLGRHIEYIHYNPVKHGWVSKAADWPYSSFHRFVRDGLVPPDWGLAADVQGSFGE
jgi:putative transposase